MKDCSSKKDHVFEASCIEKYNPAPWGVQSAGACFSKVPRTFRARKAICKTMTCLFCIAGLFICCKGNKSKNNCKVSCLETLSF